MRAPPKLKSMTAVCAPKVQKPIRVFSLKLAASFLALAIGVFGAYFFPVIGDILPVIIHAPENCLVFLILLSNILKFSFLPSCFNFPEYILYFILLCPAEKPHFVPFLAILPLLLELEPLADEEPMPKRLEYSPS